MPRFSFILKCAVFLAILVATTSSAEVPSTIKIAGRVIGASGQHTVRVALWDADGFLQKPAQAAQFAPGADTRYEFTVPPGRWAISAYEDRNENGTLDMGFFGPKEPTGFWRAFHGWHKPHFDEVAMSVEHDVADADVQLE
jgi:uncharacterized protein (DUF2141 family)